MEIKRDDPKRRKSFRARHNCDNPGPKTKARYWSCYQWRGGQKVEDDFKPTGDMLQEKEEMKEIPKKVKKIAKELDAAVKMHTSQAKRLRDAGISEDENACGCDEITEGKKNKPTKPALWSRAKALAKKKFDVYPSAYANGWAAKWYKKRGGGWKTVNESVNSDVETKIKRQLENLGGLSGNDHANKKTRTRLAQIIKAAAK